MPFLITFATNQALLTFNIVNKSDSASFSKINKLFIDKLSLIKVDNNQEQIQFSKMISTDDIINMTGELLFKDDSFVTLNKF